MNQAALARATKTRTKRKKGTGKRKKTQWKSGREGVFFEKGARAG